MRVGLEGVDVALRRGGRRRALGLLFVLTAVVAYSWTLAGGGAAVSVASLATLVLALGVGLLASASSDVVERRGRPATVVVDDDQLRVSFAGGPSRRWSLSRVRGGWRRASGQDGCVVLRLRGGTRLTIWAPSPADADVLVMAATGTRATRFPLDPTGSRGAEIGLSMAVLFATPVIGILLVALVGATELSDAVGIIGLLLVAAALGLAYVGRAMPLSSVVVGSEGLAWGRFGGRRRRYADLLWIEQFDATVLLTSRQGTDLLETVSPEVATALRQRIEEARAAYEREPPSIDWARLDRSGRSLRQWQDDLSRVLDEAGYRASALSPDALLRIAEDARAQPERRVAASVALATRGEARRELRVAADRCAHPALRMALSRAAEGELDLEAIEAARRAYEPPPVRGVAQR